MTTSRALIYPVLLSILLVSCTGSRFFKKTSPESATFLLCSLRGNNRSLSNAERFGFFSSKLWQHYEENLQTEIDVFGATPGYILWYIQMGEEFPLHVAEHNRELGISTVINHDLKSDQFTPEQNEQLLREIARGEWDDYFREFAKKARDLKVDVYYRFGYEMNGNWFPWCGKPKPFVAAWRHTWKLFKKEKASNVKWVFSPSVVWGQRNFKNDILPYYPGEQYVNIVALDGYNFGDNHDKYHSWESFYHVYAGSVAGLLGFNKPMWIAEIGCPSDPRRQKWLRDFLDFFDNNSCFEAFFWFNENKEGEPNFRIDGDDASLYIFREWAQRVNPPKSPAYDVASCKK
jgi:mannan endo-1,4-beta-mannosidase